MTEMRTGPNREQRCALHLMDLCRAYRDDPARPRAWASLEEYRVRGAELRRRAEFIRAAQARSPLERTKTPVIFSIRSTAFSATIRRTDAKEAAS
jgi:hypothetical protein